MGLIDNKAKIKEIEIFAKEKNEKFKKDKTRGLFKIALKCIISTKIKHQLNNYKRIKIEKLANSLELDVYTLIEHLKISAYENKINVVFDEEAGIIENFEDSFYLGKLTNELKSVYKNVNEVGKDLIDNCFRKAEARETLMKEKEQSERRKMEGGGDMASMMMRMMGMGGMSGMMSGMMGNRFNNEH